MGNEIVTFGKCQSWQSSSNEINFVVKYEYLMLNQVKAE